MLQCVAHATLSRRRPCPTMALDIIVGFPRILVFRDTPGRRGRFRFNEASARLRAWQLLFPSSPDCPINGLPLVSGEGSFRVAAETYLLVGDIRVRLLGEFLFLISLWAAPPRHLGGRLREDRGFLPPADPVRRSSARCSSHSRWEGPSGKVKVLLSAIVGAPFGEADPIFGWTRLFRRYDSRDIALRVASGRLPCCADRLSAIYILGPSRL
jgi:hypothetical protein